MLDVVENITLPVQLDGRKVNRERLQDMVALLGLHGREKHLPNQLSGGQQQRVSIARALALNPQLMLFDEPTSALDPELTGEILAVIRDLASRRMSMVVVTHEMSFARDVADKIIFMDGGVIVEEGIAEQVIDNPQSERTQQFLKRYGG